MPDSINQIIHTLKLSSDSLHIVLSQPANSSNITQWLSLAIALLAIIVGPAIQISIAKRQIRATVLSANRQQWLNSLREQVAEYNSVLYKTTLTYSTITEKEKRELHSRAVLLSSKIQMFINPDKPLQKALFDSINNSMELLAEESDGKKLAKSIIEINHAAQKLFRDTWIKVKNQK
jgi:hypothetical protein